MGQRELSKKRKIFFTLIATFISLITILVLSEMILRIVPEQTSGETWGIAN